MLERHLSSLLLQGKINWQFMHFKTWVKLGCLTVLSRAYKRINDLCARRVFRLSCYSSARPPNMTGDIPTGGTSITESVRLEGMWEWRSRLKKSSQDVKTGDACNNSKQHAWSERVVKVLYIGKLSDCFIKSIILVVNCVGMYYHCCHVWKFANLKDRITV